MFDELGPKKVADLRRSLVETKPDGRRLQRYNVLEVKFKGEEALDKGAPFRAALQGAADDLFSPQPAISLMTKCSSIFSSDNSDGSETFLPRTDLRTSRERSMMHFVGILMGLSAWSLSGISFSFPSLIWTMLAGEPIRISDIQSIDYGLGVALCQFAQALHGPQADSASLASVGAASGGGGGGGLVPPGTARASSDAGENLMEDRTFVDPWDHSQELVPGGSFKPVTLANASQYIQLVQEACERRYALPCTLIRQGILKFIPARELALCTGSVLKHAIQGEDYICIDRLWEHLNVYFNDRSPEFD